MRGVAALSPVRTDSNQMYPIKGSWGTVATSTPNKQGNNDYGEAALVAKRKLIQLWPSVGLRPLHQFLDR
ncbi:hypothetical protein M0R45_024338 [Rubus argutus]|uniref:Uncharacterized protein n=1 Tax=Rubus argutus TaxID=59490 RepID=A0AAW1WSE8_RUBAR